MNDDADRATPASSTGDEALPHDPAAEAAASSPPYEDGPVMDQLRALRQEVAALGERLDRDAPEPSAGTVAGTPGREARSGPPAAPSAAPITTPHHDQIARQLRDRLIAAEEELQRTRRELQRAQRDRDAAEIRRRQLLASRTWRWGRSLVRVVTAPVNAARRLYGFLLSVLPGPANRALRRAVAAMRGGREPTSAAPRGRTASGPGRPAVLVPIPASGPDGVGASLDGPSVLLVALGVDEAALSEVVEELTAMRERVQQLRVLLVTDCDAFHVLRAHQLLFEYLPPREQWQRHGFAQTYDEFRQARMAELLSVYAPDRVVHVRSADDLRGLPSALYSAA